ncbi:MAG: alpha/beta fold hydrolase [Pseudomonadota bacterium]|nr:alpha/beta fold hydrolase [Pseudomonadota bacterium]
MARAPEIDTVISNFTPRFITSGVPLADFQQVTAGLEKWEDWLPRWAARAEVHEALGLDALENGNSLSASEHLTTASLLYHFAKFMAVQFPDKMRATHKKAIECHRLALPHMEPPGERVAIPFEGKKLYGNLRKPPGIEKPPVVILVPGLEATKEEIFGYSPTLLARGMATLPIDGPGQGEAEYDLPIRGDYESVATAIIDWIECRPDLNAKQVGIFGVSLGGYHAPRAAAFEKRIKACVSISGAYDWAENWDKKSDLNKEVFRIRSHAKNLEEAHVNGKTLTLKDCAKEITCPIYIVAGGLDRITAVEAANQLAADVSGPKVVSIVEDGNHVCHNRPYSVRPQTADWLAAHLGGR